jgi:hypothetical protein
MFAFLGVVGFLRLLCAAGGPLPTRFDFSIASGPSRFDELTPADEYCDHCEICEGGVFSLLLAKEKNAEPTPALSC